MFLPMMACRLMLSLKRAASEPTDVWTLSNSGRVRPMDMNGTIQFVAPTLDISGTLAELNGEDLELGPISRPPRG